jgi:hypothetical protein
MIPSPTTRNPREARRRSDLVSDIFADVVAHDFKSHADGNRYIVRWTLLQIFPAPPPHQMPKAPFFKSRNLSATLLAPLNLLVVRDSDPEQFLSTFRIRAEGNVGQCPLDAYPRSQFNETE